MQASGRIAVMISRNWCGRDVNHARDFPFPGSERQSSRLEGLALDRFNGWDEAIPYSQSDVPPVLFLCQLRLGVGDGKLTDRLR